MKIQVLVICILLVPGTLFCNSTPPSPDDSFPRITADKRKQLMSEGYRESMRIDGVLYAIPRQWVGRKVKAQPLTYPELSRIPTELAYNGGDLYLLKAANEALQAMASEAAKDDVLIKVHSAYRSVWYQRKIFKRMLAQGRSFDDIIQYVAPPGYSEHALGTVVDLYPSNWAFAQSPEYMWLKEHASEFHYKESYPEHKPDGQPWEAWHWRWIPPDER